MTLSFLVYFQSLSTFHSLPKIPDIHLKLFILLYHSVVLFRHHFFKTDVLLHLRLISCHIHLCLISYGILFSIHKRPEDVKSLLQKICGFFATIASLSNQAQQNLTKRIKILTGSPEDYETGRNQNYYYFDPDMKSFNLLISVLRNAVDITSAFPDRSGL